MWLGFKAQFALFWQSAETADIIDVTDETLKLLPETEKNNNGGHLTNFQMSAG